MKKYYFPLLLMLVLGTGLLFSFTTSTTGPLINIKEEACECSYGGKKYSSGSTVCMSGSKHKCVDETNGCEWQDQEEECKS